MSQDDAKWKLIEEVKEDLRRELRERRTLRIKIETLFLGTQKGTCPVCEKSKTLIHLKEGITACKGCLDILVGILIAAREPMAEKKLLLSLKLQKLLDEDPSI